MFLDSKLNGIGEYEKTNGEIYKGNFENDKLVGKAECYLPNGDSYIADFDGIENIKSILKYTSSDGSHYVGDFNAENKFLKEGKGKFSNSNGNVYEGDFKDDKMHGVGKYFDNAGGIYEGGFENGM